MDKIKDKLEDIQQYKEGPYDSLQQTDNGFYYMYNDIKHLTPDVRRYRFGHWGTLEPVSDGYFVRIVDVKNKLTNE